MSASRKALQPVIKGTCPLLCKRCSPSCISQRMMAIRDDKACQNFASVFCFASSHCNKNETQLFNMLFSAGP